MEATRVTEICSNPAENGTGTGHRRAGTGDVLRPMYVDQLTRMHLVRSEEAIARGFGRAELVRGTGETWFVDPSHGEGHYWFHPIEGDVIVASMDMTLARRAEAVIDTVPHLAFGIYEHAMPSYCSPQFAQSRSELMGHDWRGGPWRSSFDPGMRFSSTSIALGPEAVRRYAGILGLDLEELRGAVTGLSGSCGAGGLLPALRSLDTARPTAAVAHAYYPAKVVECLSLLVSCARGADHGAGAARLSDRDCVEGACRHIDADLSADLSTKALCGIAHVSEAKLISAFRNIKGDTPQGYIRKQRLEHGRRLLLARDMGIGDIARAMGYRNQGAFAEAFKRAYGVTPRAYRKSSTTPAD